MSYVIINKAGRRLYTFHSNGGWNIGDVFPCSFYRWSPFKTKKHRIKLSEAKKGNKCYLWKGGKAQKYSYTHIVGIDYKLWREAVFKRDNWTCQKCGARSKSKKPIYLQAHYLRGWTKYPKLRYKVNNGITLCKCCHLKFHKINNNLIKHKNLCVQK